MQKEEPSYCPVIYCLAKKFDPIILSSLHLDHVSFSMSAPTVLWIQFQGLQCINKGNKSVESDRSQIWHTCPHLILRNAEKKQNKWYRVNVILMGGGSFEWSYHRISFTDSKVRTTYKINSTMWSTIEAVLQWFEWSYHRISFTDSKVRTTY